ncbi:pyridoxine 5'-phosphate synthase [Roseivirga pacifica]|uniref:pyridoxine 5'-phosphate synthase n=1 Tax=Roseivirga pacifica TaxID=1267423 RepID=UPI0020962941|nr:pyridoxine 5'-phosphate synthase [Roseivirga pacifica]MCO6359432.1 pyridoxine 5'-phosphate synthase [Roseivirga pacifica]MCO6366802.1 pyridoxine 5'-phosphate synthase [Roseivirga pacifica]MCO6370666.1 pyridoxine 5'-phosphate synthase [Roseivirga pacifica]MCO6374458.1 pyridoxine 5'-phosphate synthase [Roseivirga pacifica]MCO6379717.1 pyridoxine 5'-phosphate synthase [Roseivirga pacifica]
MTKLSVNINKIATIRNARGGNNPNVVQVAKDAEQFGAQGITVHPRPDERHITTQDVYDLKEVVTTEYNIEGYPDERYLKLIEEVRPAQATLVPDPPHVLTSNAGWDTQKHEGFLKEVISHINSLGVRSSIFVEPNEKHVEGAKEVGTNRIELYTEMYATGYESSPEKAIADYKAAAAKAHALGLGINAGHDLDLTNLKYLVQEIPYIDEVSIGHALVCDALYYGLENTIQLYLRELR